jgi:hypothetical protein
VSDPPRSRKARELAERALVRLVLAYGDVPEFVLLGGLVPDLLCSRAPRPHVGTTDVDVQVDLEIQGGSANAARLERALQQAGFEPDSARIWRWHEETAQGMVVKIEFLADLDDVPNQEVVRFDDCDALGAVNLRGTGFAARDWELRTVTATVDGQLHQVRLRVANLAAYLLAKVHAANGRSLAKDWYDIAYVLLHNDEGGPTAAAQQTRDRFGDDLVGSTMTAIRELQANFGDTAAQGTIAYAQTMLDLHPELDGDVLVNDAVTAVTQFVRRLQG